MQSAGTGGNDWVIRDCAVDEGTPAPAKTEVDREQGGW
jgi:hypothetical protein